MRDLIIEIRLAVAEWLLGLVISIVPKSTEGEVIVKGVRSILTTLLTLNQFGQQR